MQRFNATQKRAAPFSPATPQQNRSAAPGQAQSKQDSFATASPYGQQSGGAFSAWSPQTPAGIGYSPGIGKQVITDYRNPQTGQTFQAPSSNYRPQPGSGWERVEGPTYTPPQQPARRPEYTAPGRPDARTPDNIFQDQYNSEAFQRSIRDKPAAFVQKRVDGLRQQAEKQYWVDEQSRRVSGADPAQQKNMADTWAYVSSLPAEEQRRLRQDPNAQQMFQDLQAWRQGAPPAIQSPGQAQPQQSPYAGSSPYGQQPQPGASQQPQRPLAAPQQAPAAPQDQGARIRELLQGFNIPAGVMDQISGMFGGGQPGPPQAATPPWPTAAQLSGSQQARTAYAARPAGDFLPGVNYSAPWQNDPSMPLPAGYEWRRSREGSRSAGWLPARVGSPVASAPSSPADVQALQQDRFNDAQRQVDALRQQQFPQMPPPPPGFGQFGTPQAQQQMYQDSMMAWTMPKQNLLGWGQQAVQQPWAPNYGNMPANFRPMPYEISYNNPFGSSPMDITQNRDAFIGSILNNQANRFVGTQTQPGPVNRPAYDPSQLWQQAQGMLGGGWQNPFAAR